MKRILFFSLFFLLILAACERPAREVPEDVNGEETPTNTLDEAKPEEALPGAEQSNGETTSEPAPAGEGDATGDTTETEGETADETESGEATETEGDTTIVPATEDEQPQNITYEIESGDTLYAIGVLYGVSVDDIVRANNLPNADSLEVGQLIIIPVGGLPDEPAATNGEGSDDGEATTSEELIHIVSAGQTLFSIAQQYGLTVADLVEYNNIANPDVLEVGQQIKIPPR